MDNKTDGKLGILKYWIDVINEYFSGYNDIPSHKYELIMLSNTDLTHIDIYVLDTLTDKTDKNMYFTNWDNACDYLMGMASGFQLMNLNRIRKD